MINYITKDLTFKCKVRDIWLRGQFSMRVNYIEIN